MTATELIRAGSTPKRSRLSSAPGYSKFEKRHQHDAIRIKAANRLALAA